MSSLLRFEHKTNSGRKFVRLGSGHKPKSEISKHQTDQIQINISSSLIYIVGGLFLFKLPNPNILILYDIVLKQKPKHYKAKQH